MTGAPMPAGADAVVMIEHTRRTGDRVSTDRSLTIRRQFQSARSRSASRRRVLAAGARIGFAEIAVLATVGRECVPVHRMPRVAILPTGDEIVEAGDTAARVSDSQFERMVAGGADPAGGRNPEILPIARDNYESTRTSIERGLASDLLVLSGGVSAGKYDIVERVLADLGATFFFDRVLIQPGQPLVFGRARDTFFFGLPGNPASTMVTFELFARAAIDRLSGILKPSLPLLRAKLTREFRHKPGLTRFLPAKLSGDGSTVDAGDRGRDRATWPSLARANAFLVADADRETWNAGDDIRVLIK